MASPTVGFRNGDLVAKNISFNYTLNPQIAEPGVINANGQLLIGSIIAHPSEAMRAGFLKSDGGTLTFTYDDPDINVEVAGGGGIVTLTGNTGGPFASIAGNFNIKTDNTTVVFAGTLGNLLLDFGLDNLLIGVDGSAITTADRNVSLGAESLGSVVTGMRNTALGFNALTLLQSSDNNVAVGINALSTLASGTGENVGIGENALANLLTGENNVALGTRAGQNYTAAESSNICIASDGLAGEDDTIRIGTNFTHIRAFFQGISGVTVEGSEPVAVNSVGQLSALGFGTIGQVLTSNDAGNSPTWQNSAIGAITFTGNDGVPETPDGAGNFNLLTANTTVKFLGSVNAETLNFGLTNLMLGASGTSVTTADFNVSVGNLAMALLTTGGGNTAIGYNAGHSIDTGNNNTFLGLNTGTLITSSSDNTAVGIGALSNLTTGSGHNVAIGQTAGGSLITGQANIFIGTSSGQDLTGAESSNIYIGNQGSLGESNTIRLGSLLAGSGTFSQNRAFVTGIASVTAAASAPVLVNASHQLSSAGYGTFGQVFTSAGASTSPFWSTTPRLYAFVSAASVPNVTGDGTGITFIFNTIGYQSGGSNYNTATGVYTVPTDGFYQVSAMVGWSGAGVSHTRSNININCSSGTLTITEGNPATGSSGNNNYSQTASLGISLTAGDTVKIDGFVQGGTKTVGYNGNFFGVWTYLNIHKVA